MSRIYDPYKELISGLTLGVLILFLARTAQLETTHHLNPQVSTTKKDNRSVINCVRVRIVKGDPIILIPSGAHDITISNSEWSKLEGYSIEITNSSMVDQCGGEQP
jgi:hypothetical protein